MNTMDTSNNAASTESEETKSPGRTGRSRRVGTIVAATAVVDTVLAMGAFILSFDALRELAVVAGVRPELAWIWPVIVDGVIVVATMNAIVLSEHRSAAAWYPWAALGLFSVVSIAGNGLHAARHADPAMISIPVAAVVSTIPAIALLIISHLIVVMLTTRRADLAQDADVALDRDENPPVTGTTRPPNESTTASPSVLERRPAATKPTRTDDARHRDDQQLVEWIRSEVAAGRRVTGAHVGAYLGRAPATGRRRLQALRRLHPDLATTLDR